MRDKILILLGGVAFALLFKDLLAMKGFTESNQGAIFKIIFFHVPMAITALTCALVAYLHRRDALPIALFCSLISGALLLRMLYVLLGRVTFMRADPFMSPADTFRVRQRRFRALFRGGAALGAFYVFALLYQAQLVHLHFDREYVFVGLSIVFQLLWLAVLSAQGRDAETRDFSVYRADGGTRATP